MRKKILAIVFAALLTLAVAVPAFAGEDGDQDGDGNTTQANPEAGDAQGQDQD